MELATSLKTARQQAKLSQQAVANELHISRQSISKWETGKTLPDIENLIRLSTLFDLSLDDLIKGDSVMMTKISHDSKLLNILKMVLATLTIAILFALIIAFSLSNIDVTKRSLFWIYVPVFLTLVLPIGALVYATSHVYKQINRNVKIALVLALAGIICATVLGLLAQIIPGLPYLN